MSLAFVGGIMNIGFMGLATVIMTLEKMPRIGDLVSIPLTITLFCTAMILTNKINEKSINGVSERVVHKR